MSHVCFSPRRREPGLWGIHLQASLARAMADADSDKVEMLLALLCSLLKQPKDSAAGLRLGCGAQEQQAGHCLLAVEKRAPVFQQDFTVMK